jgi:hypothetical protein
MGGKAQVGAAVVNPVVVDVVDLHSRRITQGVFHDDPMHEQSFVASELVGVVVDGIAGLAVAPGANLHEEIVVGCIEQRLLALREGNEAGGHAGIFLCG